MIAELLKWPKLVKESGRSWEREYADYAEKKRQPALPFWHMRVLKSGASSALACSFHGTLRLPRRTHRHHLANFVTTCGCICLRVQRELLQIKRLARHLRVG